MMSRKTSPQLGKHYSVVLGGCFWCLFGPMKFQFNHFIELNSFLSYFLIFHSANTRSLRGFDCVGRDLFVLTGQQQCAGTGICCPLVVSRGFPYLHLFRCRVYFESDWVLVFTRSCQTLICVSSIPFFIQAMNMFGERSFYLCISVDTYLSVYPYNSYYIFL